MTPHIWMSNPVRSHLGPKGKCYIFLNHSMKYTRHQGTHGP